MDAPDGIEVTRRVNGNGTFVFLLNHGEEAQVMAMPFAGTNLLSGKAYKEGDALTIAAKDVAIVRLST